MVEKVQNNKKRAGPDFDKKQSASVSRILRKYATWLMILEIIVILSAGYLLLLQPKWQRLASDELGDVMYWEDRLVEAQTNFTDVQRLVNSYNNVNQTEQARLDKILPNSAEAMQLMSQLEALFLSRELLMQSITMAPASQEDSGLQVLDVSFSLILNPGYENFKEVLALLEDHIRIINIESIHYRPGSTSYQFITKAFFRQ